MERNPGCEKSYTPTEVKPAGRPTLREAIIILAAKTLTLLSSLALLGSGAGEVSALKVAQSFSGNASRATAAGCSVKILDLGYQFMDNPTIPQTSGLIDPQDFVLPPVKMGEAVAYYNGQEIARSNMIPRGDHEETIFELNQEPNAKGSDQSPALRLELGFSDDQVRQSDGRPVTKPLTLRCGRSGWFYGGRYAPTEAIDTIAQNNRFPIRQVGTSVDEATKRIFGTSAGIAPEADNPEQNLKDLRANLDKAKKHGQDVKAEERKKASPTLSLSPEAIRTKFPNTNYPYGGF